MITVERLDAGLFEVYLVFLRPPRQAGGGPLSSHRSRALNSRPMQRVGVDYPGR